MQFYMREGFHGSPEQADLCRSEGFTLHGLWPNLDNPCPADYPEHCDSSVFDPDEIPQDVLQSMEKLWPSYSTCAPLIHPFASLAFCFL